MEFSEEFAGTFAAGPGAPTIISIGGDGKPAVVNVKLPAAAKDGSALTVLKALTVFYKNTSMKESTAAAELSAGTPFVSVPLTPALAGQVIQVDIDGLDWGPEYFFRAGCD